MDAFLEDEKKKGTNKIFLVGGLIALLAVAGIITAVYILPSPDEEKQAILENAYHEGSPEFENYTKEIVISTDPDRLIESYTGLGDIIMQIGGSIHNKGDKTINGLEVSVGMINRQNELIKDKKVLIIPKEYPELKPKETIDVSVNVPGFTPDDNRANARWKVTAIKFKEEE
jgi:hypothetical protein